MPKGPWYLVLSRTIWHGPNTLMDILENTKCHGSFAMNQISIGTFGQVQLACKNYSHHLYPKSNADQLRGWSPLLRGIGVTFLEHATDKRRVKNEFGGVAKFAPPHLLKNYFILPSVPQISYQ